MKDGRSGGVSDSEAFFYLALDPLSILDAEARFVRVNPAWEAVLGYPVTELTGTSCFDIVHPDDLEATREAHAALSAGGAVADFVNRIRAKDGSYRWIEWQSISPDGSRIYSAARDITVQREAEDALRASESKFSTAFHTSPDAVNINRLSDGLFMEVNEGFTRLTGFTEADVAGKTSLEIDIWADPEDRRRLVRWLQESGRVDNLEAGFRSADGSVRTGLMSARTIDLHGEPCILSVTRDISLRKAAEREVVRLMDELESRVHERTSQLAAANEELALVNAHQQQLILQLEETNRRLDDATRAKNDFLASMSHELRTPLNSIIGFSGILLAGLAGPLGEEQRKQIAMVSSAGRHLLALINNVLDLSKIEAGHVQLHIEEVELATLAAEAIETMRPIAAAKGVSIGVEGGASGRVRTDRTRVRQVLLNLLGNAVKFTDEGAVALEVVDGADEVALVVADTGRGIEPDELPHIFEEFYQGASPGGGKTAGTGLGLSVSARLAAMLGGRIEVRTGVGEGSVFELRLPKAGPPEGGADD